MDLLTLKLLRTVRIFREKIENSLSGARFLHMTSNLIISSRCQDEIDKEMFQNELFVLLLGVAVVVAVIREFKGSLATTTGTATRTSSQNINSHYCNHFTTIASLLM